MASDINDLHTRLALCESEIKTIRQTLKELETNQSSITQAVFELKENVAQKVSQLPVMFEKIERVNYSIDKIETVNDRFFAKFDNFEHSFNEHIIQQVITATKVKFLWAGIAFLLSSTVTLLIQVIRLYVNQ